MAKYNPYGNGAIKNARRAKLYITAVVVSFCCKVYYICSGQLYG